MLNLSELGLLYRMVVGFVNERQRSAGPDDKHGSMAEQVGNRPLHPRYVVNLTIAS